MYKQVVRPLLFAQDAEDAHYLVAAWLRRFMSVPGFPALARSLWQFNHPSLEREVFGIRFPNPVGLAAGFDKDAAMFSDLQHLGFGFIEVGTLTPRPQPGNDKPRLFRLPADEAIINRMGFNNQGVEVAAARLEGRKTKLVIGGNIGKNKSTPNEEALKDYVFALGHLAPHVDYFVVNVSSPNTPGLRELQEKGPLMQLMQGLKDHMRHREIRKPLLLKIAPDLNDHQLDDIIDIITRTGTDGLIATNTTISREGLKSPADRIDAIGQGGLSGLPLKEKSTEIIHKIVSRSNHAFPVIGCGGIFSADDARRKLDAGASLVQIYTGFIYEGPALIKNILKGLADGK